jgi:signal transduction histidine kinase
VDQSDGALPDIAADPRRAVDALPDGVVIADGEGTVRLVNDRAAALLGLPPDAAEGKPLADVLAVTNQDGVGWVACTRPYDGLVTRTGVPEQSWVLPSGEEVLVTARIHRAPGHGPVTDVAVSLRSGRARARLDRDRSDLVATVAHELRSPLTGVKGFVQALLNRWDRLNDEQKKLMLTTVHADSDRLSRLITELLDVARLDTGRLSMHPRPCDVPTLTQRVIDSVRAGAPHRIELESPPDLPAVWADPDKFTQVLTNLVENAIRHGSDPVTVTAYRDESPGDLVAVQVDDSGDGIPPEIRRRAFTKFWTTGQRGGSGLGLYLANGLVKAHGGTVTIGDAPGGGARIVTTWPAFTPDD